MDLHPALKGSARRPHPGTLNWGTAFADRFTTEEAETLWSRFESVDALLQAEEAYFEPGFQSGPMKYFFNRMPEELTVEGFIAGWTAP